MHHNLPPAPWQEFLPELDKRLTEPVELHCIGGFVVSLLYGMPRPTADVDFLTVAPHTETRHLLELAGHGSALHKKFGLYLQHVGVASLPEEYEARLIPMISRCRSWNVIWGVTGRTSSILAGPCRSMRTSWSSGTNRRSALIS